MHRIQQRVASWFLSRVAKIVVIDPNDILSSFTSGKIELRNVKLITSTINEILKKYQTGSQEATSSFSPFSSIVGKGSKRNDKKKKSHLSSTSNASFDTLQQMQQQFQLEIVSGTAELLEVSIAWFSAAEPITVLLKGVSLIVKRKYDPSTTVNSNVIDNEDVHDTKQLSVFFPGGLQIPQFLPLSKEELMKGIQESLVLGVSESMAVSGLGSVGDVDGFTDEEEVYDAEDGNVWEDDILMLKAEDDEDEFGENILRKRRRRGHKGNEREHHHDNNNEDKDYEKDNGTSNRRQERYDFESCSDDEKYLDDKKRSSNEVRVGTSSPSSSSSPVSFSSPTTWFNYIKEKAKENFIPEGLRKPRKILVKLENITVSMDCTPSPIIVQVRDVLSHLSSSETIDDKHEGKEGNNDNEGGEGNAEKAVLILQRHLQELQQQKESGEKKGVLFVDEITHIMLPKGESIACSTGSKWVEKISEDVLAIHYSNRSIALNVDLISAEIDPPQTSAEQGMGENNNSNNKTNDGNVAMTSISKVKKITVTCVRLTARCDGFKPIASQKRMRRWTRSQACKRANTLPFHQTKGSFHSTGFENKQSQQQGNSLATIASSSSLTETSPASSYFNTDDILCLRNYDFLPLSLFPAQHNILQCPGVNVRISEIIKEPLHQAAKMSQDDLEAAAVSYHMERSLKRRKDPSRFSSPSPTSSQSPTAVSMETCQRNLEKAQIVIDNNIRDAGIPKRVLVKRFLSIEREKSYIRSIHMDIFMEQKERLVIEMTAPSLAVLKVCLLGALQVPLPDFESLLLSQSSSLSSAETIITKNDKKTRSDLSNNKSNNKKKEGGLFSDKAESKTITTTATITKNNAWLLSILSRQSLLRRFRDPQTHWKCLYNSVVLLLRDCKRRYNFNIDYLKRWREMREKYMNLLRKLMNDRIQFSAYTDELGMLESELIFRDVVFILRKYIQNENKMIAVTLTSNQGFSLLSSSLLNSSTSSPIKQTNPVTSPLLTSSSFLCSIGGVTNAHVDLLIDGAKLTSIKAPIKYSCILKGFEVRLSLGDYTLQLSDMTAVVVDGVSVACALKEMNVMYRGISSNISIIRNTDNIEDNGDSDGQGRISGEDRWLLRWPCLKDARESLERGLLYTGVGLGKDTQVSSSSSLLPYDINIKTDPINSSTSIKHTEENKMMVASGAFALSKVMRAPVTMITEGGVLPPITLSTTSTEIGGGAATQHRGISLNLPNGISSEFTTRTSDFISTPGAHFKNKTINSRFQDKMIRYTELNADLADFALYFEAKDLIDISTPLISLVAVLKYGISQSIHRWVANTISFSKASQILVFDPTVLATVDDVTMAMMTKMTTKSVSKSSELKGDKESAKTRRWKMMNDANGGGRGGRFCVNPFIIDITKMEFTTRCISMRVDQLLFYIDDIEFVNVSGTASRGNIADIKSAGIGLEFVENVKGANAFNRPHPIISTISLKTSLERSLIFISPFEIALNDRVTTMIGSFMKRLKALSLPDVGLPLQSIDAQHSAVIDLSSLLQKRKNIDDCGTCGHGRRKTLNSEYNKRSNDSTRSYFSDDIDWDIDSTRTSISTASHLLQKTESMRSYATYVSCASSRVCNAAIAQGHKRTRNEMLNILNWSKRPMKNTILGLTDIPELRRWVPCLRRRISVVLSGVTFSYKGQGQLEMKKISLTQYARVNDNFVSMDSALAVRNNPFPKRIAERVFLINVESISSVAFGNIMSINLTTLSCELLPQVTSIPLSSLPAFAIATDVATHSSIVKLYAQDFTLNLAPGENEPLPKTPLVAMTYLRMYSYNSNIEATIEQASICGESAVVNNTNLTYIPRKGATPVETRPTVTADIDMQSSVKKIDLRGFERRFALVMPLFFDHLLPICNVLVPQRTIKLFMSSLTNISVGLRAGKLPVTLHNGSSLLVEIYPGVCENDKKEHNLRYLSFADYGFGDISGEFNRSIFDSLNASVTSNSPAGNCWKHHSFFTRNASLPCALGQSAAAGPLSVFNQLAHFNQLSCQAQCGVVAEELKRRESIDNTNNDKSPCELSPSPLIDDESVLRVDSESLLRQSTVSSTPEASAASAAEKSSGLLLIKVLNDVDFMMSVIRVENAHVTVRTPTSPFTGAYLGIGQLERIGPLARETYWTNCPPTLSEATIISAASGILGLFDLDSPVWGMRPSSSTVFSVGDPQRQQPSRASSQRLASDSGVRSRRGSLFLSTAPMARPRPSLIPFSLDGGKKVFFDSSTCMPNDPNQLVGQLMRTQDNSKDNIKKHDKKETEEKEQNGALKYYNNNNNNNNNVYYHQQGITKAANDEDNKRFICASYASYMNLIPTRPLKLDKLYAKATIAQFAFETNQVTDGNESGITSSNTSRDGDEGLREGNSKKGGYGSDKVREKLNNNIRQGNTDRDSLVDVCKEGIDGDDDSDGEYNGGDVEAVILAANEKKRCCTSDTESGGSRNSSKSRKSIGEREVISKVRVVENNKTLLVGNIRLVLDISHSTDFMNVKRYINGFTETVSDMRPHHVFTPLGRFVVTNDAVTTTYCDTGTRFSHQEFEFDKMCMLITRILPACAGTTVDIVSEGGSSFYYYNPQTVNGKFTQKEGMKHEDDGGEDQSNEEEEDGIIVFESCRFIERLSSFPSSLKEGSYIDHFMSSIVLASHTTVMFINCEFILPVNGNNNKNESDDESGNDIIQEEVIKNKDSFSCELISSASPSLRVVSSCAVPESQQRITLTDDTSVCIFENCTWLMTTAASKCSSLTSSLPSSDIEDNHNDYISENNNVETCKKEHKNSSHGSNININDSNTNNNKNICCVITKENFSSVFFQATVAAVLREGEGEIGNPLSNYLYLELGETRFDDNSANIEKVLKKIEYNSSSRNSGTDKSRPDVIDFIHPKLHKCNDHEDKSFQEHQRQEGTSSIFSSFAVKRKTNPSCGCGVDGEVDLLSLGHSMPCLALEEVFRKKATCYGLRLAYVCGLRVIDLVQKSSVSYVLVQKLCSLYILKNNGMLDSNQSSISFSRGKLVAEFPKETTINCDVSLGSVDIHLFFVTQFVGLLERLSDDGKGTGSVSIHNSAVTRHPYGVMVSDPSKISPRPVVSFKEKNDLPSALLSPASTSVPLSSLSIGAKLMALFPSLDDMGALSVGVKLSPFVVLFTLPTDVTFGKLEFNHTRLSSKTALFDQLQQHYEQKEPWRTFFLKLFYLLNMDIYEKETNNKPSYVHGKEALFDPSVLLDEATRSDTSAYGMLPFNRRMTDTTRNNRYIDIDNNNNNNIKNGDNKDDNNIYDDSCKNLFTAAVRLSLFDLTEKTWISVLDEVILKAQITWTSSRVASCSLRISPLNVVLSTPLLRALSFIVKFGEGLHTMSKCRRRLYKALAVEGGGGAKTKIRPTVAATLSQEEKQQHQLFLFEHTGECLSFNSQRRPSVFNGSNFENISSRRSTFSLAKINRLLLNSHVPFLKNNQSVIDNSHLHILRNETGYLIEVTFADKRVLCLPPGTVIRRINLFSACIKSISFAGLKEVFLNPFIDVTATRDDSPGLTPSMTQFPLSPQVSRGSTYLDSSSTVAIMGTSNGVTYADATVDVASINSGSHWERMKPCFGSEVLFLRRSVTYVGDAMELCVDHAFTDSFIEEIRISGCCFVENHTRFYYYFYSTPELMDTRSSALLMKRECSENSIHKHQHYHINNSNINTDNKERLKHLSSSLSCESAVSLGVPPYSRVSVPCWLLDDRLVSMQLCMSNMQAESQQHTLLGQGGEEETEKIGIKRCVLLEQKTWVENSEVGSCNCEDQEPGSRLPLLLPNEVDEDDTNNNNNNNGDCREKELVKSEPVFLGNSIRGICQDVASRDFYTRVDCHSHLATLHLNYAHSGLQNGMRFDINASFFNTDKPVEENNNKIRYSVSPQRIVWAPQHASNEKLFAIIEIKTQRGHYVSQTIDMQSLSASSTASVSCKLYRVGRSSAVGFDIEREKGLFGRLLSVFKSLDLENECALLADGNTPDTNDFTEVLLVPGSYASMPVLHVVPHPNWCYLVNRTHDSLSLSSFSSDISSEDSLGGGVLQNILSLPGSTLYLPHSRSFIFKTKEGATSSIATSLRSNITTEVVVCECPSLEEEQEEKKKNSNNIVEDNGDVFASSKALEKNSLVNKKKNRNFQQAFVIYQQTIPDPQRSLLQPDPDFVACNKNNSNNGIACKSLAFEILPAFAIVNGSSNKRLYVTHSIGKSREVISSSLYSNAEDNSHRKKNDDNYSVVSFVVEPLKIAYHSNTVDPLSWLKDEFFFSFSPVGLEYPMTSRSSPGLVLDRKESNDNFSVSIVVNDNVSDSQNDKDDTNAKNTSQMNTNRSSFVGKVSSHYHNVRVLRADSMMPIEVLVEDEQPAPLMVINATEHAMVRVVHKEVMDRETSQPFFSVLQNDNLKDNNKITKRCVKTDFKYNIFTTTIPATTEIDPCIIVEYNIYVSEDGGDAKDSIVTQPSALSEEKQQHHQLLVIQYEVPLLESTESVLFRLRKIIFPDHTKKLYIPVLQGFIRTFVDPNGQKFQTLIITASKVKEGAGDTPMVRILSLFDNSRFNQQLTSNSNSTNSHHDNLSLMLSEVNIAFFDIPWSSKKPSHNLIENSHKLLPVVSLIMKRLTLAAKFTAHTSTSRISLMQHASSQHHQQKSLSFSSFFANPHRGSFFPAATAKSSKERGLRKARAYSSFFTWEKADCFHNSNDNDNKKNYQIQQQEQDINVILSGMEAEEKHAHQQELSVTGVNKNGNNNIRYNYCRLPTCQFDFNIDRLLVLDYTEIYRSSLTIAKTGADGGDETTTSTFFDIPLSTCVSESIPHSIAIAPFSVYFGFYGRDPPLDKHKGELIIDCVSVNSTPVNVSITDRLIFSISQLAKHSRWITSRTGGCENDKNNSKDESGTLGCHASIYSSSISSSSFSRSLELMEGKKSFTEKTFMGDDKARHLIFETPAMTPDRYTRVRIPPPQKAASLIRYITADSISVIGPKIVFSWERSNDADLLEDRFIVSMLFHSVRNASLKLPNIIYHHLSRYPVDKLKSEIWWSYFNGIASQWRSIIAGIDVFGVSKMYNNVMNFCFGWIISKSENKEEDALKRKSGGYHASPSEGQSFPSQGGQGGDRNDRRVSTMRNASDSSSSTLSSMEVTVKLPRHSFTPSWLCFCCDTLNKIVKNKSFRLDHDTFEGLLRQFGPIAFLHHSSLEMLNFVMKQSPSLLAKRIPHQRALFKKSGDNNDSNINKDGNDENSIHYTLEGFQNILHALPLIDYMLWDSSEGVSAILARKIQSKPMSITTDNTNEGGLLLISVRSTFTSASSNTDSISTKIHNENNNGYNNICRHMIPTCSPLISEAEGNTSSDDRSMSFSGSSAQYTPRSPLKAAHLVPFPNNENVSFFSIRIPLKLFNGQAKVDTGTEHASSFTSYSSALISMNLPSPRVLLSQEVCPSSVVAALFYTVPLLEAHERLITPKRHKGGDTEGVAVGGVKEKGWGDAVTVDALKRWGEEYSFLFLKGILGESISGGGTGEMDEFLI